jgi:hypothetical protein
MLLDVGGTNFKLEALVDFVLLELAQLDVKAIDFRVELVDLGDAFAKLTQVAGAELARNGGRQICKVVGCWGAGLSGGTRWREASYCGLEEVSFTSIRGSAMIVFSFLSSSK